MVPLRNLLSAEFLTISNMPSNNSVGTLSFNRIKLNLLFSSKSCSLIAFPKSNDTSALKLNEEDKFKYDVWYVDNISFQLDLKIITLTLFKIFSREGISQSGQATAEEFNPHATRNRNRSLQE